MNESPMISASLLCANIFELPNYLKIMENKHIEYLHMDVFDGHYVKNFGFPPNILRDIRKITQIPFDIHLCVSEPENLLHLFDIREKDILSACRSNPPYSKVATRHKRNGSIYMCCVKSRNPSYYT